VAQTTRLSQLVSQVVSFAHQPIHRDVSGHRRLICQGIVEVQSPGGQGVVPVTVAIYPAGKAEQVAWYGWPDTYWFH